MVMVVVVSKVRERLTVHVVAFMTVFYFPHVKSTTTTSVSVSHFHLGLHRKQHCLKVSKNQNKFVYMPLPKRFVKKNTTITFASYVVSH